MQNLVGIVLLIMVITVLGAVGLDAWMEPITVHDSSESIVKAGR